MLEIKTIMNLREEFKQLIQEQEYQKEYSYEQRCEIFDRFQLSTSITYFNPIMALSTLLIERGRTKGYELVRHGISHSGAVATAFNQQVKEDKSPYIKVTDRGTFDVVKIFHYIRGFENKYKEVIMYVVRENNISIKFINLDFFAEPNFCYFKTANDFLEAIGKPRFFIHNSQLENND